VRSALILGCIDIGSNTTRLLVADVVGEELRELATERVFTCIRKGLTDGRRIPPQKLEETVAVATAQGRKARELGATEIVPVATAAIRGAANREELERGIRAGLGVPLRVLSDEEEARLAFLGATRTLPSRPGSTTAVVDVGGGSTEIAIGVPGGEVQWWTSLPVGSGLLADEHLRSDPPTHAELAAVGHEVAKSFEDLAPPRVSSAAAVGGTATSLRRLLGDELDHRAFEGGMALLREASIAELAQRLDLDRERVRLLPAGILVLQAASDCLGHPLRIACGGVREGVLLDLVQRREAAA
jgi:exopolyphosphatase/guanosine-5'-triphosphate,3'-diphosphate pyrophosphatase